MNWIEKIIQERFEYNYSPIAIVETNDLKYTIQVLTTRLYDLFIRTLLYIPYRLYEVKKDNGKVYLEELGSIKSSSLPFPIQQQGQNFVDPESVFNQFLNTVKEIQFESTEGQQKLGSILLIYVLFPDSPNSMMSLPDFQRIAILRSVEILSDPQYVVLKKRGLIIFVTNDSLLLKPILHEAIYVKTEPLKKDVEFLIRKLKQRLAEKYGLILNIPDGRIIDVVKGLEYKDIENVLFKAGKKFIKSHGKISFIHEVIKAKNELLTIYESALEPVEPRFGFEAVGGYDEVKNFVKQAFVNVWKYREIAEYLGAELPKGMLLFGIRGTGKTWFVQCMAKEVDIPMYKLVIERLMTAWYGETEKAIKKIFDFLRKIEPVILFIDEVDKIMTQRGLLQEHEVSRRIKNIFLEELSKESKLIFIGTTNFPEQLDDAFLRAGRIDIKVPFLLPDVKAREQILHVHTHVVRKVKLNEDVDLRKYAKLTHRWTGAELELLVKTATMKALNEIVEKHGVNELMKITKVIEDGKEITILKVTDKHFEDAYRDIQIDREERENELKRFEKIAKQLTSHRKLIEYVTKQVTQISEETKLDTL